MAVFQYSRHTFTEQRIDENGKSFLDDRKPYGYRVFPDNVLHTVVEGDALWSLAGIYFRALPRPSGLWWVIADFQPNPIHDPTIALVAGSIVVIPSARTVREEIFSEDRRRESRV